MFRRSSRALGQASWAALATQMAVDVYWRLHRVTRTAATWQLRRLRLVYPVRSLSLPVALPLAFPSSCAGQGLEVHLECPAVDVCAAFLDLGVVSDPV